MKPRRVEESMPWSYRKHRSQKRGTSFILTFFLQLYIYYLGLWHKRIYWEHDVHIYQCLCRTYRNKYGKYILTCKTGCVIIFIRVHSHNNFRSIIILLMNEARKMLCSDNWYSGRTEKPRSIVGRKYRSLSPGTLV